MKELYSFRRFKGNGDKVTTYRFAFKELNRREREQSRIWYSKEKFAAQKAGMPTAAMVSKLQMDGAGGILTEQEEQETIKLRVEYSRIKEEVRAIPAKKYGQKKQEQETIRLIEKLETIKDRLLDLEMLKTSIYEDTAEVYARNKVIEYLLLNYSYWQKAELADDEEEEDYTELENIFPGDDMEAKYESLDKFDTDDIFWAKAVSNLTLIATWYWQGQATTSEEFRELFGLAEEMEEKSEKSTKKTAKKTTKKAAKKKATDEQTEGSSS